MKLRDLNQTVNFKIAPHVIYEALLDSKTHSEITGDKASISKEEGAEFSAYSGYIKGKNLKLEKDKQIKQLWRGEDWPEGHYSTLDIKLKERDEGTMLILSQKGIPAKQFEEIKQGWIDFYWEPMKRLLE